MKKIMTIACLTLFVVVAQTSAYALSYFDLEGVDDSRNSASVSFDYNSTSYLINIAIKNTSTFGDDPRITAFAFNTPSEVTGVSSFSGPEGWGYSFVPNTIGTPGQFGFFDAAGLTGNNFEGGDPNDGIPVSYTFNFSFQITGTNLNTLNDMSFLGLFSDLGNQNQDYQYFIARFQRTGVDGADDSDVAIPGTPVPEPAIMLLFGTGLVGLVGVARRRNKK